jgi:hypothetical protein
LLGIGIGASLFARHLDYEKISNLLFIYIDGKPQKKKRE